METSVKMKKGPKIIAGIIGLVAIYFLIQFGSSHGWIPMGKSAPSQVPQTAAVGDVPITQANKVVFTQPSTTPVSCKHPPMRFDIWAWSAQLGWILANGGQVTTKGSLMDKYGSCVQFKREDVSKIPFVQKGSPEERTRFLE